MRTGLVVTITPIILMLLSTTTLTQVAVYTGFKGGVSVANVSIDDDEIEFESKAGFCGGWFTEVDFLGPLAMQGEVLYTQKGTKLTSDFDDAEFTVNINYLEIPILVKMSMPVGPGASLAFYGGGALDFKLTESFKLNGQDFSDGDDVFNGSDIGISFGSALKISMVSADFIVDVRYTIGLTNIDSTVESGDPETKNRALTVTAALSI